MLPIGGLKEKLLAAHRGKIKTVLIPKENEKDLKDIPTKILRELDVVRVEHMDEVLKHALALEDPEKLFKKGKEPRGVMGAKVGSKDVRPATSH